MSTNKFRLYCKLNKLSETIAMQNADKLGLGFDRYFDKVIGYAIKNIPADTNISEPFEITRKEIRKGVLPERHQYIQKLAQKNNTTVSSVIETLLVAGIVS